MYHYLLGMFKLCLIRWHILKMRRNKTNIKRVKPLFFLIKLWSKWLFWSRSSFKSLFYSYLTETTAPGDFIADLSSSNNNVEIFGIWPKSFNCAQKCELGMTVGLNLPCLLKQVTLRPSAISRKRVHVSQSRFRQKRLHLSDNLRCNFDIRGTVLRQLN